MTDRDLLELAAKAAGLDAHWGTGWQSDTMFVAVKRPSDAVVANVEWNPLADDGDALRLAVMLELQIRQVNFAAHAGWPGQFWSTERHGDDKAAATRRAIVRAAADIGKAMP